MTAPGPLDGITVVSLEQAVAAPLATRHLADLGARVIKVERPEVGDFARSYDRSVHGEASYFVWLNRGKESVELDLKHPADRGLLDAMIAAADVVMQNLAPGAAERLGLDGDAVRQRHPAIVHCSISGYGTDGPYRDKKAYDLLVQCETGLPRTTGTPNVPSKVGISVADIATGMYAHSSILAALFRRECGGMGATLHVAMIDALAEWMTQPLYYSILGGHSVTRTGARHASIAPYGPYRAGDGDVVFLAVQNDREWVTLCEKVLGRHDLVTDHRFAHNTERVTHDNDITLVLEDAFGALTADAVVSALDAAGVACARMRDPGDLLDHPQLVARDRWRSVGIPGGARAPAMLPPLGFTDTEFVMGDVPRLGEHNASLRTEFGGQA